MDNCNIMSVLASCLISKPVPVTQCNVLYVLMCMCVCVCVGYVWKNNNLNLFDRNKNMRNTLMGTCGRLTAPVMFSIVMLHTSGLIADAL